MYIIMESQFSKEDLGRKVLVVLEMDKIDEDWSDDESNRIPYDSIINHQFLVNISTKSNLPRIKDTSRTLKRLGPVSVGKALGAETMTVTGYITEVGEDYLMVRQEKSRNRYLI